MTTTNAAYLVISQNPNNPELDCIDEFTSLIEACDFANEFGGVVVSACGAGRAQAPVLNQEPAYGAAR